MDLHPSRGAFIGRFALAAVFFFQRDEAARQPTLVHGPEGEGGL